METPRGFSPAEIDDSNSVSYLTAGGSRRKQRIPEADPSRCVHADSGKSAHRTHGHLASTIRHRTASAPRVRPGPDRSLHARGKPRPIDFVGCDRVRVASRKPRKDDE
jgi:hypothetical protein